MLVEDNEDDVFLAGIALKAAGVTNRMLVARDGQEALDYLGGVDKFADRHQFPFPGLVLLDLKLPYRSGLEVLAWLREQTHLPAATVVVLSSSDEPRDLAAAYKLGAKSYLVKPPTAQMIYDLVKAFRLNWLTCDAAPAQ